MELKPKAARPRPDSSVGVAAAVLGALEVCAFCSESICRQAVSLRDYTLNRSLPGEKWFGCLDYSLPGIRLSRDTCVYSI